MIASSNGPSHLSPGEKQQTFHSRDTTPADSNFGTPSTMGPPPSANQTFVYQQVSAQNFTPINSQPAPYDPNATLPRAHSGYVPAAAFSHQPGAVTPGGIYGQTAMSSVTPVGGSMYQTPMSAMSSVTPGQYSVMTPGSNISAYDPNASPGPMQSVPMLSASSGVHTPPRYPVCLPSGPVGDPNLELNLMGLGDLPSIGSAGHFNGTCKRCCFHEKGRCQNGAACLFCHFPHEKRIRKNKNRKNKTRTGVRVGQPVHGVAGVPPVIR